jgi:hypothetical protein
MTNRPDIGSANNLEQEGKMKKKSFSKTGGKALFLHDLAKRVYRLPGIIQQ